MNDITKVNWIWLILIRYQVMWMCVHMFIGYCQKTVVFVGTLKSPLIYDNNQLGSRLLISVYKGIYIYIYIYILVIRKGRRLHEVDLRIHLTCAFNELRVGAHSLLRHWRHAFVFLYKGYQVYCWLWTCVYLLNISLVRCVKSLMFDNLVRIIYTWDFLSGLIDEISNKTLICKGLYPLFSIYELS